MRSTDPYRSNGRVFTDGGCVAVAMVGECLCHGSWWFPRWHLSQASCAGVRNQSWANRPALSFANLAIAFSVPAIGRMAVGSAPGVILGVLGLGACLIRLARTNPPVWHALYLIFILIGIMGAGAGPVTYQRVVANWFDRRRGLALGLTAMGLGFGAFLMPVLADRD